MYHNQIELCGNVGKVEIFDETSGKNPFARVSLATNKRYEKSNGEVVERPQWHTLMFFGNHINFVKGKVAVGKPLSIIGELDYREWQTKEGEKRISIQINVRKAFLVESWKAEVAKEMEAVESEAARKERIRAELAQHR